MRHIYESKNARRARKSAARARSCAGRRSWLSLARRIMATPLCTATRKGPLRVQVPRDGTSVVFWVGAGFQALAEFSGLVPTVVWAAEGDRRDDARVGAVAMAQTLGVRQGAPLPDDVAARLGLEPGVWWLAYVEVRSPAVGPEVVELPGGDKRGCPHNKTTPARRGRRAICLDCGGTVRQADEPAELPYPPNGR